jgi:Uma2 family endonuclease
MSTAHALPPEPIAPWAEIVPGVGPMTVRDLLDYPDDGYRYEVVEGVLIRVAGSRPKAGRITRRLFRQLDAFVRAHDLGTVTLPDEVYDFERTGQPNTGLLPDIGFYYAFREAMVEDEQPYPFAPDLAVEVASPLQKADAMAAKAARYLRGGTSLVWIIWTATQTVDVWRPGDSRPSTTLTEGDLLDGEDVIPGFRCPLAEILA